MVGVQGRVQTREYEDRNGVRCQVVQVVADKVTFLGPSKRGDDHHVRRRARHGATPTVIREAIRRFSLRVQECQQASGANRVYGLRRKLLPPERPYRT